MDNYGITLHLRTSTGPIRVYGVLQTWCDFTVCITHKCLTDLGLPTSSYPPLFLLSFLTPGEPSGTAGGGTKTGEITVAYGFGLWYSGMQLMSRPPPKPRHNSSGESKAADSPQDGYWAPPQRQTATNRRKADTQRGSNIR